ncbi:uncharacterized protein NPIL_666481 [Nephila pilipes]|uniref:Kelch repeat protein n=1 Tax=Nephila pilipes TaxID=299642 RepID=A0A8X6UAJ5_NEPPI|nr:uncharacterized protein NPIL_666481 [Nephila pilipes]
MCCGRKAMGTTAFSGRIWIAGGLIQADKEINFQVVSHVDCYDPKHKRWLFNVNSLPSPRCYCSLTVWMGRICCVGGMIRLGRDKMSPTDEVCLLNSETEMWNNGPALPIPRMGSVALVNDRYLYVVGGFDPEADVAIRNVNRLAPGAISWEIAAPVPTHLYGLAAVSCNE